jgi:hypothetical protein
MTHWSHEQLLSCTVGFNNRGPRERWVKVAECYFT